MFSALTIFVPTICYCIVAANEVRNRNWGFAIVFGGYALANVGFIWNLMAK